MVKFRTYRDNLLWHGPASSVRLQAEAWLCAWRRWAYVLPKLTLFWGFRTS